MTRIEKSVNANFLEDLGDMVRSELTSISYTIANESVTKLTEMYYNVLERRITPISRKVERSKEFSCPPNHQYGINIIENKVRNGLDLNPHISKKINDPNYHDLLLNDWGIYHFHLGTSIKRHGFVKRDNHVLMARVTDECFYFINVWPHGNWSNMEVVEIIHHNWPDSIAQFKIEDAYNVYPPSSKDMTEKFRKAGFIYPIELKDGSVYLPIGGGYMSTGLSQKVRQKSDSIMTKLVDCEKYIKDNVKSFVKSAEKQGIKMKYPLSFKLEFDNDKFYVREINNEVQCFLMDNNGFIAR